MAKRIAVCVLTLCLLFLLTQCTQAPAPEDPVDIAEISVPGEIECNTDGLALVRDESGLYSLVDRTGAVLLQSGFWMEYDSSSNVCAALGEAYYSYPDCEVLFTREQMEENVTAFLQENAPLGEVVSLRTNIMSPFSEGYAANDFTVLFDDGYDQREYDFYALIDKNGLVHYATPLLAYTSGGGFPLLFTLDDSSEGLVRFTSEYCDRDGFWSWYEVGFKDSEGNDVLVFSNGSNRDPDDTSVTVIDGSPYSHIGSFYNGFAVIEDHDQKQSLIDRAGNVLLPFAYDSIQNHCGSYPAVSDIYKGWGYIDTAGEVVIPLEYGFAAGSYGTYFVVERSGKYGVVDADNEPVVPFEYDWMSSPYEGVIYANKEDRAYVITFKDVK